MNAPVGSGRRVLNCAPPAAMAADAEGAATVPTAATPATRRAVNPALRERREREKKCFTFMRLLFGFPPAGVAIGVLRSVAIWLPTRAGPPNRSRAVFKRAAPPKVTSREAARLHSHGRSHSAEPRKHAHQRSERWPARARSGQPR